jgi:hypothetical protein
MCWTNFLQMDNSERDLYHCCLTSDLSPLELVLSQEGILMLLGLAHAVVPTDLGPGNV